MKKVIASLALLLLLITSPRSILAQTTATLSSPSVKRTEIQERIEKRWLLFQERREEIKNRIQIKKSRPR